MVQLFKTQATGFVFLEKGGVRKAPLQLLGISFFWGWLNSIIIGTSVVPKSVTLPFSTPPQLIEFFVLSIGFILILAFKHRLFTPEPRKTVLIWVMLIGIIGTVGILLPINQIFHEQLGLLSSIFGYLMTGSSGALILVYWLWCYKAFPLRIVIFYICISSGLAAIWCMLLACLLLPVAAAVLVGFPLATAMLLLSSLKLSYQQNQNVGTPNQQALQGVDLRFWRIIFGILAFAVCFGVIRFFIPNTSESSLGNELAVQSAVILASLIALAIGMMTQMKSYSIISKVALPITALSLLSAIIVGDAAAVNVRLLAVLGFILFTNLGLVITVLYAKQSLNEDIRILALGRLADSAGVFVGGAIGVIASIQIKQDDMVLALICAILLLLLILVSTIVMGDKTIVAEPSRQQEVNNSHGTGKWRKKCDILANQNSLTSREREVLLLLAKGKSAESIANSLVISPHTAKTHTRNIFTKLAIHSRQDLLKLLEDMELEKDEGHFISLHDAQKE